MREYNKPTRNDVSEYGDFIIDFSEDENTEYIRTNYFYHSDDTCYWAKEIDGKIHYSDDDVFSSEKEEATHMVIFMK